jgi:hypothetical protein
VEGALVRGMAIRGDQRTPTPEALIGALTGAVASGSNVAGGAKDAPGGGAASSGATALRRRYNEDEVQQIIGRAAEIEATNPTQSGAMTVGGVEALAAEVGIAPETVRQAAQGLAAPGSGAALAVSPPEANRPNRWIGGPTRLLIERVVEGEVPEAEFPVMVEEIRRWLNRPGQVSQIGRTFSWTSAGGAGSTRNTEVSVVVRGGQTRISMREGLGNLIGGIFGGIGGGMGGGGMGPIIGLFAGFGTAVGVMVVVPFWLATTYAVARTSYYYAVRRRQRELDSLADRLAALAQELVPRRAPGGARQQLPR